jgi:hypothetical protein
MKDALKYLLEKQLLKSGKYLECARRKIEAYLKCAPNNIEDRMDKYLLQRKLLDVDVNVNEYFESLKTIKLLTISLRPSADFTCIFVSCILFMETVYASGRKKLLAQSLWD